MCVTFAYPQWIRSKRKKNKKIRKEYSRSSGRTENERRSNPHRRWPFFTHEFSLFPDATLLTPQGTECAPITYIEKVNLSDFFEKLPYTYTSKCKICGRVVSNLKNHYLTHNPGNYVCPLCGCRRTRLDNLKCHIKQKHPEIQILQKSSDTVQTWTYPRVFLFLFFFRLFFFFFFSFLSGFFFNPRVRSRRREKVLKILAVFAETSEGRSRHCSWPVCSGLSRAPIGDCVLFSFSRKLFFQRSGLLFVLQKFYVCLSRRISKPRVARFMQDVGKWSTNDTVRATPPVAGHSHVFVSSVFTLARTIRRSKTRYFFTRIFLSTLDGFRDIKITERFRSMWTESW